MHPGGWLVWGVQERLKRKREGEEQGEVGKTKGFSSAALKKYQKKAKATLSHQLRDDIGIDLEPVDHESWEPR